jgi:hypothetical protein
MHAQSKGRRGDLIPVIVTVILAVMSIAGILFDDFGPGNNSHGNGNATTAAVVSKAGAILTPSEPPAGPPAA